MVNPHDHTLHLVPCRAHLGPSRRAMSAARAGFALVDVVIAGVILAIGLGMIMSLSGRSISAAQRGEELATAAMLADEQLNTVLSRGPDDYARRFGLEGACEEPFSGYRYRLEFGGGRSVGEPYDVRVTIEWGVPGGSSGGARGAGGGAAAAQQARSLTIATLMAPREIGEDVEVDPDRRPQQSILRGAGVAGAATTGGGGQ